MLGLEVAAVDANLPPLASEPLRSDARLRRARRAAERDVLALAVVMHGLLAGAPALRTADIASVIARLPPRGRESLRLPWDLPRPVPESLRAIVNRATDRQPRQRYRNARTLARALEGWLESDGNQGGDAHAQLIERVRQIGALPALPGAAARAARLALMEREHTEELAQVVLRDPALSFELLKSVNSAQVRGTQVSGNGPVLTVRRAIAMIGLDGVRRCALGLRHWPGPLDGNGAHDLEQAIAARPACRTRGASAAPGRLRRRGGVAGDADAEPRPAGGALPLRRRDAPGAPLMQPAPATAPSGEGAAPDEPGLSELAAAYAVLGADIEGMGAAVARWWGMDDAVLHMIRRLPPTLPVRQADSDDDVLRAVGSAANEAVDTLALARCRAAGGHRTHRAALRQSAWIHVARSAGRAADRRRRQRRRPRRRPGARQHVRCRKGDEPHPGTGCNA